MSEQSEAANEHEKPWTPLTVGAVAAVFASAPFPWWIAGGVSLELAVGQPIRAHGDIDVLLLRRDARRVRHLLQVWDCWVADPPGRLRAWSCDEPLPRNAHDVWVRTAPAKPWCLQLMFDEAEGDEWVSRRNPSVRCGLQNMTCRTDSGVPYLAPHVQLFYKAKHPRGKDLQDRAAVLESSVAVDHAWLRDAISSTYGDDHPWLADQRR